MSGDYRIESNMAQIKRRLTDVGQKQLPFALAGGLTGTARQASDAEKRALPTLFDRPVPFTVKNAIYLVAAKKDRPVAEIGAKRTQATYLEIQAKGGTRRPRGRAILVPRSIRLNKYGNMARTALRTAKAKGDTFSASRDDPRTKHLEPGLYKRPRRGKRKTGGVGSKGNTRVRGTNSGLQQLVAYAGSASYRRRFPFQKIAERKARKVFEPEFIRAFERAMRSAR